MIADSVRLALPREAAAIAGLQRRAWSATLPPGVAEALLDRFDVEDMTRSWHQALIRPPLATFRVLVAVSGEHVAGFACQGPSDDPDADSGDAVIAEFVVDPRALGRGHGSRLLNACADVLRADGFARANWWVRADDDSLRRFLIGAGWAPDGAHRQVATDDDATRIKLIRLQTTLG